MALFAAYCAYNTQSKTRITGVLLANIEALADGTEVDRNKVTCYSTFIDPIKDVTPITATECGSCLPKSCSSYTDKGVCRK